MTVKEAITWLKGFGFEIAGFDDPEVFYESDPIYKQVIDSLEENLQENRFKENWELCSICTDKSCDTCFWRDIKGLLTVCCNCENGDKWSPKTSYCHNCGRPLTDEAWNDLNRRINNG